MSKILAIIPARSGSKRIPQKNIKEFLDKPIIYYSINAALSSKLFNEVMVSTDEDKIANIAVSYGAKVPFLRSSQNSNDYATTSDVIFEVLSRYEQQSKVFDYVCCIYPTAPFVNPQKLADSFNLLVSSNADVVIPVIRYSYPIERSFRLKANGTLSYIWPDNVNKRSQEFESSYHDAGQFYWINVVSFIKQNTLVTENTMSYIISEFEAQDIDNQEDWVIAEKKYLLINNI